MQSATNYIDLGATFNPDATGNTAETPQHNICPYTLIVPDDCTAIYIKCNALSTRIKYNHKVIEDDIRHISSALYLQPIREILQARVISITTYNIDNGVITSNKLMKVRPHFTTKVNILIMS